MKKETNKDKVKKELKRLFKSMDFISENYLGKEDINEKESQIYFNIYQQLGLAWEFLGLQCKHWDGYKMTKDKKESCKICGIIKGVDDQYCLFPKEGLKKLGRKLAPNSQKIFMNERKAKILNDTINFHGALLNVDVHNAYKSGLGKGNHRINMAAERIVTLKESGIECYVDQYLIYIKVNNTKKKLGKKNYGGFPWEIKKKDLKYFPVIFDFDENHQFLGLTILRK
jgi:hypothetical protein